jgi:hypothetical protein
MQSTRDWDGGYVLAGLKTTAESASLSIGIDSAIGANFGASMLDRGMPHRTLP